MVTVNVRRFALWADWIWWWRGCARTNFYTRPRRYAFYLEDCGEAPAFRFVDLSEWSGKTHKGGIELAVNMIRRISPAPLAFLYPGGAHLQKDSVSTPREKPNYRDPHHIRASLNHHILSPPPSISKTPALSAKGYCHPNDGAVVGGAKL
jgi:hypothetical protein